MRQSEYQAQVELAGDNLIENLDTDEDATMDLESQAMEAIHDLENTHPLLNDDDRCADILKYSNNPSAEAFHHGGAAFEHCKPGDAFPWKTFASAAFSEDVKDYLRRTYNLDTWNNENLRQAALSLTE